MATNTTKWNLRKPTSTDLVVVEQDIGDNMQKIDDGAVVLQNSINSMQSVQTGNRNAIRNGDMGIAQRGNGPFTTSAYNLDGWRCDLNGTATFSITRVPITSPASNDLSVNGAANYMSTAIVSGAGTNDYVVLCARIEDVRLFAGKTVTLSFLATASAGTPKIGLEVVQRFGSGGSPSSSNYTSVGAVTLTGGTNVTKYSITFTMPSLVGFTIGTTDFTSHIYINLWLSAGPGYASNASNIGFQSYTLNLTDVQLEAGSSATIFERLNPQAQLSWCQRYYWRRTYGAVSKGVGPLIIYAATDSYSFYQCPVEMRVTPTATVSAAAHFSLYSNGGTTALTTFQQTSLNTAQATPSIIEMNSTHGAATVGGAFIRTSSSLAWIEAKAEL